MTNLDSAAAGKGIPDLIEDLCLVLTRDDIRTRALADFANFDLGLDQPRDRAGDRVGILNHVRDLARFLDHAIGLARELSVPGAPATDIGLGHVEFIVHDLALIRGLVNDLTRAVTPDPNPASASNSSHYNAFRLIRDYAADVEVGLASVLADRLRTALTTASDETPSDSAARRQPLRVSRSAQRAVGIAVRILPATDQLRYAEEYRSELFELARQSRRAQWAWVVRLVVCSPMLRRELRSAAPAVMPEPGRSEP